MNPEVERVFYLAAELAPEERTRFFAEHSVADEVRHEVESLLQFDRTQTQFIARRMSAAVDGNGKIIDAKDLRCGPYRLERLLGSGGMGAVYLAQREDGEVKQKAAVKLLSLAAFDLREHFLRERQILASLNHNYIARLLDAGHADGQPYLVMEFVEGVPIDEYAKDKPVDEKLLLMVKVCEAVAHAHRNLVVHRDLKPNNILVTDNGDPKLLDFGIAKVLGPVDPGKTIGRFMTPAYASPEQVKGGAISTMTDVYSLGAILYKLLTGESPHMVTADSGDSWERAVLEREPTRPSTVDKLVPKDLDYVVAKALRKEPEERYVSVEQFAEDLLAVLESRPVRARKAGFLYRARKFVRRHRVSVAASVAVAVAFGMGVAALNRERTRAQKRFGEVQQLTHHLLFDVNEEIRRLPGATGAQERLLSIAVHYLDSLSEDAREDPALMWDLLNGYARLAVARGGVGASVGRSEEGLRLADKAMALAERVELHGITDEKQIGTLFSLYDGLAIMYVDLRRKTEAERVVGRLRALLPKLTVKQQVDVHLVVSRYEEAFGSAAVMLEHVGTAVKLLQSLKPQSDALLRDQESNALSQMARAYAKTGSFEKSLESYERSLRAIAEDYKASPDAGKTRRNMYFAHLWAADVLAADDRFNLGRVPEAEMHYREAMALAEKMVELDPRNQAVMVDLARACGKLGSAIYNTRPAESLALMNRAYEILQRTSLSNANAAEMKIAYLRESVKPLIRLGRVAQARANIEEAARVVEERGAKDPTRLKQERFDLKFPQTMVLEAEGRYREALALTLEDLQHFDEMSEPETLSQDFGRIEDLGRIARLGDRVDPAQAFRARQRLVERWEFWSKKLTQSTFVSERLKAARLSLATSPQPK